jgi:antitoxin VapB
MRMANTLTMPAICTTISIMDTKRAKLFMTGRSQAVRLPKEFRFTGDTVLIRREGSAVILEPDGWPEGWIESFAGISSDFERPNQGKLETREKLE